MSPPAWTVARTPPAARTAPSGSGTCAPNSRSAPLPALPNHYAVPQFTPDGDHLFAITDAGRVYRWDMRPTSGRGTAAP